MGGSEPEEVAGLGLDEGRLDISRGEVEERCICSCGRLSEVGLVWSAAVVGLIGPGRRMRRSVQQSELEEEEEGGPDVLEVE